ncbi:MAG: hypothetical protein HOE90_25090 [Bacteriovoracaceae bacterium]|jgi:hypothetical protein|nr:hypothetical protein [Bacteriovoracaceae bacterium]
MELLQARGAAAQYIETSDLKIKGMGIPTALAKKPKEIVVVGSLMAALVADEVGANFSNSGPTYFYDKENKAAGFLPDGTPVRACKDTNPGSMHFSAEVWNQPMKFELNGEDRYLKGTTFEKEEWMIFDDTSGSEKCSTIILREDEVFGFVSAGSGHGQTFQIRVGDELPSGVITASIEFSLDNKTSMDIAKFEFTSDNGVFLTIEDVPVRSYEEADAIAKSVINKVSARFIAPTSKTDSDQKTMFKLQKSNDELKSLKELVTGILQAFQEGKMAVARNIR